MVAKKDGGMGANERLRRVGEWLEAKDVKGTQTQKDMVSARRTASVLKLANRSKTYSNSTKGGQTRRAPNRRGLPTTK